MSKQIINAFKKIEDSFEEINELHDELTSLNKTYLPEIDDLLYEQKEILHTYSGYEAEEVIEVKVLDIENKITTYQMEIETTTDNIVELFDQVLAEVNISDFRISHDEYLLDVESLQDEVIKKIKKNSISIEDSVYHELLEKFPDKFL